MSEPHEAGTVGEWTYLDHRMARFEDRQVFSWVAALDDEGTRWSWVVMLPGREPESRTQGEAPSALEAARAADALGGPRVVGSAKPEVVERWTKNHLEWRIEVDSSETEATHSWNRRAD